MIELNGINKKYDVVSGSLDVLKNVSLQLPDTGLVFILGKSGSGKTTLLNLLAGLDRPDSGTITYNSFQLNASDEESLDHYRNCEIGIVFQDYNLIENLNVYDNIALALEVCDFSSEMKADKIHEIMEFVEIDGLDRRNVKKLSGGQRQRVAIARALVKEPRVIFADEPTGNLDSKTGDNIFHLLKKISSERLVVVITHDENTALEFGDRIVRIQDGIVDCEKKAIGTLQVLSEDSKQKVETRVAKPLPFKRKMFFAVNNIIGRPFRSVITIFLFGLSLLLLLSVLHISFFDSRNVISNYLKKYEIKTVSPYFYSRYTDAYYETRDSEIMGGTWLNSIISNDFEENDILPYSNKLAVETVDRFDPEYTYWEQPISAGYPTCFFGQFKTNDAFELCYGKFPTKDDEVAISDYLANFLFDTEDALGEKIKIGELEAVISGIIKTDYVEYRFDYKKNSDINWNYTQYHQKYKYEIALLDASFIKRLADNINVIDLDYANFAYCKNEGKYIRWGATTIGVLSDNVAENIVLGAGDICKEEIDVVISNHYCLNQLVNLEQYPADVLTDEIYSSVIGKEYGFIDLDNEEYNHYYSNSINMRNILSKVKITGVCDYIYSGGIPYVDYFVSRDTFEKIKSEYLATEFISGYLIQNKQYSYKELVESIYDHNLKIDEPSVRMIEGYELSLQQIEPILRILLYIVLSVTVLVLFSFINFSINVNRKTIGILRAIGSTRKDCITIFVLETVIISVASMFISLAGGLGLMSYGNKLFVKEIPENPFNIILPNYKLLLIYICITFIISAVSVVLPIAKLSRKQPIDIIRDE